MTKMQETILTELEQHALFGIAQAARESWEIGAPYYCRHKCAFELRLKLAEGNREMMLSAESLQPAVSGRQ